MLGKKKSDPNHPMCEHCGDHMFLIRGTHPQTGKELEEWKCVRELVPLLLIEMNGKLNQVRAEISSGRSENRKAAEATINLLLPQPIQHGGRILIEDSRD